MNVLAYGGGTDSTAILCGWVEKGYQAIDPIDAILFADTGGERPHTYAYIEMMQVWLEMNGMPPITIVKKGGRKETLEENCLRMNMLPSLAYGYKGCSHKFKIEPQEKFCNNHPPLKAWVKSGRKINKLIGYEFAESHRWMKAKLEDEKYFYEFPLVGWEWSRKECVEAIQRAGLPLPGKSACFFCPSSTKPEIDQLQREHPVLFQRAIALEANASDNLKTVKGLGRRFAWGEYAAGNVCSTVETDVHGCLHCERN